jgi:hypothetical protein
MRIDGSGIDQAFVTPDFIQQTVARLNPSTSENEGVQKLELDAGEVHRLAIDRNMVADRIDRDATGSYALLFFRSRFAAAQDRLDPQNDFPRTEGFCYIVISAKFQTDNAVNLFRLGREHQDGNVSGRRFALEDFAQFKSGDARQHQIENDQRWPVLSRLLQSSCAVSCSRDVESSGAPQRQREQVDDITLVLDDQD